MFDWITQSPASLILFDGSNVVAASDAVCRELCRSRLELDGHGLLDSLVSEDREILRGALQQNGLESPGPTRSHKPFQVRRRRSEADRSVDVFEMRLARCADGMLADVRDITALCQVDRVLNVLCSGVFVIDDKASIIWRSPEYLASADREAEELEWSNSLEMIHPDDLPDVLDAFSSLLALPDVPHSDLYRVRRPNTAVWNETRLTAINQINDPLIGGIVVRSENVTDDSIVESVGRTASGFQSLAESAPIGIIVTDRIGRGVYSNHLAEELLGLNETEGGLWDWTTRMRTSDHVLMKDTVSGALERHDRGSVVVTIDKRNGEVIWLRVDVVPQVNEAGESFGLIATLLDVTSETEARQSLEVAQNQLWQKANHDILTGLPNRMNFNERLDRAFSRRQRDNQSIGVLFCDLDHFKPVNDSYGHQVGDALLVEIARRLESTTRDADSVFRIGGDEFVVLCEGFAQLAGLEILASRLIAEVMLPAQLGEVNVRVGLSIGIAAATSDCTGDSLLAQADAALYRAKEMGRNRYVLAP